jgi:hypothetical protein
MLKKTTRKEMENILYEVFSKMDPTGANTKKYKDLFSKMNDKEFEAYAVNMFNDHKSFHILDMETYKNEPTQESLDAAGKVLGISLYEKVCYPHMSTDPNNPFVTPQEVPVGFVHIKRLQQMKRKKNSTSTRIDQRDSKTGQVTGHDKAARSSDMENYAMSTYGAKEAMKEFMSFRSDDMVMKTEAYSQIYKDGYLDMSTLTNDVSNKKTLNTLNVYMISMGLMSDLINPGYVLKDVLDDKDK